MNFLGTLANLAYYCEELSKTFPLKGHSPVAVAPVAGTPVKPAFENFRKVSQLCSLLHPTATKEVLNVRIFTTFPVIWHKPFLYAC